MWDRVKAWASRRAEGAQDEALGWIVQGLLSGVGIVVVTLVLGLIATAVFVVWSITQSLAPPIVGLIGFLAFVGAVTLAGSLDAALMRRRNGVQASNEGTAAPAKPPPEPRHITLCGVLWEWVGEWWNDKPLIQAHCIEHPWINLASQSNQTGEIRNIWEDDYMMPGTNNYSLYCIGDDTDGPHTFYFEECEGERVARFSQAEQRAKRKMEASIRKEEAEGRG